MKFGSWIHITGAMIAAILSSEIRADSVVASDKMKNSGFEKDTLFDEMSVSEEDLLLIFSKLKLYQKPLFSGSRPCVSVVVSEENI